jgi:SpoVK/Ycf46/Vps4 family AAA+-type ATPase
MPFFSKRKSIGSGNVDQTENAIQNIILEEMENLDGILIATTNLTENLDKAFERRFLFKIRFEKPTLEAKTNIWKDKIPALSEADAAKLASSYDFSGGEIDNIVRKALMQEVIAGEAPTMDALQKLCSEEKIDTHNVRIGF